MARNIPTRRLGSLEVPVLGLGGAPLGELAERIPEETAQAITRAAWEGGIRYFDTAPWYGHGLSEHRLGHFLRQQPRDEFLLSTKVGRVYRAASKSDFRLPPWSGGLPFELRFDYSHAGVMRSYEDSLMRLGLNRVDMLVIHDLDAGYHGHGDMFTGHQRALETSGWQALAELRQKKMIAAIGAGINDESMIPYFLERFEIDYLLVAMPYTLLDQRTLEEVFPLCEQKGISVVVGAPYASGILATGATTDAVYNYAPATEAVLARTQAIEAVATEYGVALPAAALQFPLGHELVTTVIPGANRPEQVTANIEHARSDLPPEFWAALKSRDLLDPNAPTPD